MDNEKFYAKAWKQGSTLVVSIPKNIVEFWQIKEGDTIKTTIQRVVVEDKENEN